MDGQKRNKIIAQEILLFFTAVAVLGLLWGFLFFRNQFYDSKISRLEKESQLISAKIDSLPKDKIKALYEGIKLKFIENYEYKSENYAVLKEEESIFLKSFPNAKHLKIYPDGYSLFKGRYPYTEALDNDMLPFPPPKRFDRITHDSTFIFDYIPADKFRIFITNRDYRDKLYLTFSEYFDLGKKLDFEAKVKDGMNFNQVLTDSLVNRKTSLNEQIQLYKLSKMNSDEVNHFLFWTTFIVALLLYPTRIIFLAVKWSINTIKKNDTE
jgi:hypothetical protein